MNKILSILSSLIDIFIVYKKYIFIGLGALSFSLWFKSFHYDVINNLEKDIDMLKEESIILDAKNTSLNSKIKEVQISCINQTSKKEQLTIRDFLQYNLEEIEEYEYGTDINTSVGTHTIIFNK